MMMWELSLAIVTTISAVFGLPDKLHEIALYKWILFPTAIIVVAVITCFKNKKNVKKFQISKQVKINNYMYDLIHNSGKTIIFSRNFSWVSSGGKIEDILIEKSKKGDLEIFLEEPIELSDNLQRHGAKIYTYKDICTNPEIRFTIVNANKPGEKLAIRAQSKDGKYHIVEEFYSKDDNVLLMAKSFLEVIKKYNGNNFK